MSGSVTDNDACGTDWEKWIPQIDSTDDKYQFTWKPPWKNFRIKICSNNKVLDNTSGFLIPLKMQFLITHHSSTVQKIIRNLESSIVESIKSTEELLEIKVKSLEDEDIFTEIERALARETDDIVMKPIQRLKFTSNLVEELFIKELKEQCIDVMRDETNIFIVGFENMKSLITKQIDEINRLTATKVVKLGDKWKIKAFKCFGITETLSKMFSDVVFCLQEETSSVYLKGRELTINKAEKEVHKLLSDLFNEKLLFDPLILKLLISKDSSEFFNEILQKEHIPVVWTVDSTHLYFFSKTKIDTDALKAIVYENFLTAGFSKSPHHGKQFYDSYALNTITKKQNNKLLFLETTMSSVNIAGTKHLIFYLLHQEKLFYNDVENTKEIQVDTLSFEVASITDEKMKIDRGKRELEVKLNELERKCKEGEEKLKRITLEKELLLRESRSKEANLITQLEELKDLNDEQKQNPWTSSDTPSRPITIQMNENLKTTQKQNPWTSSDTPSRPITIQMNENLKTTQKQNPWTSSDTPSRSIPRKNQRQRRTQPSGCQQPDFLNPSGGKVEENVSDIFYRHAVYEENIQLTRSELKFLQEQYQSEISTLQQQCLKNRVTLNIDNICVFIRGNSNGVKDAKKKIGGIVNSIYKKKYILKKAGIVKHMTRDHVQTKISQLEKRNKVVVHLQTGEESDDEDRRDQAQPISPRQTYTETAMCTTPSGQTIITVVGDITELDVDVIVNDANKDLKHIGGLAKVIVEKGGNSIQKECDDYVRSKNRARKMYEGEIFCSAPGNLNCKMIAHAVGPVWQNGRSSEDEYLSECIQASLDKTEYMKYKSIAIPALCTGIFGYPANKATKVIVEAIRDYMKENGASSSVRKIYLCDVKEDIVGHFLSAVERFFDKTNINKQRGRSCFVSSPPVRSRHGEKKAVSTNQWLVRKMPSSVLNLVVYAKKENDADSALRSLEESLINDYKQKVIEDTGIKEFSKDQEAKILKLEETCEVEIEFNKRIGRITVRGLIENMSDAMDEVHTILRDVDRQKQKQKQQHAKLVADMVQWCFIVVENTGQKLEAYSAEVNLLLEQALKNNEPQAFFLDNSGNKYIVDFTSYEEFPEDDPSDTVAVLRKSKLTGCAFDMPFNWALMDQNENIKIVTLPPADKEYQDVVQNFQTNMTGYYNSIIKIEKIQNRTLQQQYAAKKKSMDSTNAKGNNNELKLWHGTAMEAVDSINTYGFNRSYCGKNAVAYGNGVYFAVNPTYSAQAQYGRPDPNGNKRMYMCKVLVGEFTKGQGGMNVPPPKPVAAGGHILYDSVVDNPLSPCIFIIFHDTQAYPEYLIVFK